MKEFKILSKTTTEYGFQKSLLKKAAVFVHLYYEESLEKSLSYLFNLPEELTVYVYVANPKTYDCLMNLVRQKGCQNVHVAAKRNRGRDFSVLLVEAKDEIRKFDYVGFVHDKKSHAGIEDEMGQNWQKCLFECTVASNEFVCNVIHLLEKDKGIGVLSAPLPPEKYLTGLRGKLWSTNYDHTVDLLHGLNVNILPDPKEDPLTIGTAFWFRRTALDKLLDHPWSYEDFPEEPMAEDGTVCHALERAIGYVSEEAGYRNYYLMNNEYGGYYLGLNEMALTLAITAMRERGAVRYRDGWLDFPLSAKKDLNESEWINYALSYRKVDFILDKSLPKTKELMERIEKAHVKAGRIFDVNHLEEAELDKIREKDFGIIACVRKEEEATVEGMLRTISRKAMFY